MSRWSDPPTDDVWAFRVTLHSGEVFAAEPHAHARFIRDESGTPPLIFTDLADRSQRAIPFTAVATIEPLPPTPAGTD